MVSWRSRPDEVWSTRDVSNNALSGLEKIALATGCPVPAEITFSSQTESSW